MINLYKKINMENNKTIKQEIMEIEKNNKEKLDKNLNNIYDIFKKGIIWFKKNKEKVKFLIPIAIITTAFMIYMIIKTFITVYSLNKESKDLYNLNSFNIKLLENNEYTKENIKSIKTLNELIKYEIELSKEIEKYNSYLSILQKPYSNFMRHIFLPELNIRKDPFTKEIDTSIIWIKYLEKNPYNDIRLIQKRSNFIKNVWENNEFNQIEDIIVWDIVEENENFYIPINIKFVSNSKRSFLLLVEKLSTTSNQKNISLINEFVYNLRENILEHKKEEIQKIKENLKINLSDQEIIWYVIYDRVFKDKENELIDNQIIENTIRETIICGEEKDSFCFYKFRDKYRWIPSLAYTIWLENNKNKKSDLKKFLNDLPPIIKINTFTFDRNLQQDIKNFENTQYKWEIQMNIYGMWITDNEVEEISNVLWEECFGWKLTPQDALKKIENTLINVWNIVEINTNNTSNLRELQTIIENIQKEYNNLSNYKKIIKLFEIYRMMKDSNLCKN